MIKKVSPRLSILIFILFFSACTEKSPYPGYSKLTEGIWYHLYQFGESVQKPKPGDYITVDILYKTSKDSVFFSGRRKFQLAAASAQDMASQCFMSLSPGDSAAFRLDAVSFFRGSLETNLPAFFNAGDPIILLASLREIQTQEEYTQEKEAFLKWIDDFSEYEKEILQQFLDGEKMKIQPTPSGLFYLRLKAGNGRKVAQGDTLTLEYEGRFLNGKFFDSTIRRHESFQYVVGTEWQVVKGLEEGVALMEEGEKALFILPSELAFGNEGSSTGIIPPYTSLIFEVEITRIKGSDK